MKHSKEENMEKQVSRNWTTEETNLFCSILVDPAFNFMVTLERKALKKGCYEGGIRRDIE